MTEPWAKTLGATRLDNRVWIVWITLFALFSAVFPKDTGFDVAHYHLHNGWSLLNGRLDVDFAPADLHSFFNPAHSAFAYWLTQVLPGRAVNALLSLPQALILPAIYFFTRKMVVLITGTAYVVPCLLLAIAGFMAEPNLLLLSSLRNDAWSAAAFLVALVIMIRDDGTLAAPKTLALCSFVIGACAGIKLTNATYIVSFAILVLMLARSHQERFRAALACAVAGAAGLILLAGPWAYVMWREFGNPFFPMMSDLFATELVPETFEAYARRNPDSFLGMLTYPFRFSGSGWLVAASDFSDYRYLFWYVSTFAGFAILLLRRRDGNVEGPWVRPYVAFLTAMLLGSFFWMMNFAVHRYFMVAWLLGPTCVYLLLLFATPEDWSPLRRVRATAFVSAAAILLTFPQGGTDWGSRRVPWQSLNEPYVEGTLPDEFDYSNAFVVIAGHGWSGAFLTQFFPESTVFGHDAVSPWARPAMAHYREHVQQPAIASTDRDIYSVFSEFDLTPAQVLYSLELKLGLRGDASDCRDIKTTFDSEAQYWVICPMQYVGLPGERDG